ncbi:MAG: cell surface protein SprA [Gemmatimonadetes bacterium]|nr:cell surface protein SprA [Gemmatimonadota bacterium]
MRLRRDTLRVAVPAALVGAGRLAAPRPDPAALARGWADSVTERLAARAAARWRLGVSGGDSSLLLVPRPPSPGERPVPGFAAEGGRRPTILQRYADLGMQLNARFEMRLDRLRNLRCTAAEANQIASGCRGGFTPPKIEPQFNVRTGGVVGERVHVNVDYDSEREFEASNNIQVYYQGLEDEVLQRVQVGNVTFTAPSSRFITGGIPANNFGFQLEGQIGAMDWSAIFAQQKGNVVRGRTFTVGDRTVQPLDREVVDRDFEPLRFFFVVDPASLPGYPALDALNLNLAALTQAQRVTQVRVYRRRSTLGRTAAEQNLGGIQAVALGDDSLQRAGPFPWEQLQEGRDYYLDPSGLWFALTNRLDLDDFLALSYVTAAGDTVGTFPAVAAEGRVDTLRLIYEPRRAADVPTFRYEMRNVYRVGGVDDVVRESARLEVVVSESERPASGAATFLALLGLALESDPTTFDQYNRLFPRQRDPGGGAPVRDLFVVFPHLTPFADSTRLEAQFRNDSLYRTPTYLLRTQGPTPLYVMRLHYNARGGDDRSVLSLGGFQIREGSEKVTAGGRTLVRNTDYTINYEIGEVRFSSPDALFRQPTQVTVQYEENPAFAIAPTSIYGLQTRYDFGDHGAVSLIGLLQRERTTFTRPPLGFEPSSSFIAGVSGNFRFEPRRLTRLIDALPLVETEAPSRITVDVELATSRPSPNQLGVAYVETFEGEGGTFVPLGENLWEYGSRPASARGLAGLGLGVDTGFAALDAVPLIWQNLIGVSGDRTLQLRARDIDPSIVVQGTGEAAETVLWLAMHPDIVGGAADSLGRPRWFVDHTKGPRWRSMSQALSTTGLDLSRTEFLEFWVLDPGDSASAVGATIALDFGTVFEDAVDFLPTEFQVSGRDTVYTGRRRAGEGRLDTERNTLTNAFNAALDDNGILGDVADTIRNEASELVRDLPICRSLQGRSLVVYDWGNLAVHCTRRNGTVDTEDLDNDQNLDTLIRKQEENYFRYVFRLRDSPYFVRPGGAVAGGTWKLYRIPFRAATDTVGDPKIGRIQALRMTMIVPESQEAEQRVFLALARMKLVGAPWVKRAGTPIAGLAGSRGTGRGEVIASVISTENSDEGYFSPPGVVDEGASRGGSFQIGTTQINEKSLRLIGYDVRAGERAEAFLRFPEGNRNFLGYRQLRVWARGRGLAWDRGELSFYVKVAQDENNFYLYRTARDTTWEPEVVVDFNRWFRLRAELEARYLRDLADTLTADSIQARKARDARACGLDTLAYVGATLPYVACDTLLGYLVHVGNPGVAPPNLSRVQELAVGFVSGAAQDSAEIWVDDIRLTQVVSDAGYAGAVNVRIVAADVAELTVAATRRDAQFRQLGEDPSYVTTNNLAMSGTVRLERLGLERLGVAAPFTFRSDRSGSDPFFLNRTDVLASGLGDLRRPRQSSASYSLALRRTRRGTEWWQRAFVDNVALNGSFASGSSRSELSESGSRQVNVHGDYAVQPADRGVRYVPGFVRRLLNGLPPFLRRTDMVRGLQDGRLRWTPTTIQLSSNLVRTRATRQTFRVPIRTPGDTLNPAIVTQTAALRTTARLDTRPFAGVSSLGFDLTSDRDLKSYGDTTTIGVLARQRRSRFLGLDVGFERSRTLATRFNYAPRLLSWLSPRIGMSSSFGITRDPNAREPERSGDSTGAFRLPTAFSNRRATDYGVSLDISRFLRGLIHDSTTLRVVDRLRPLELSSHLERRSQFDRPGFDPDFSYQLGFGGPSAFRRQQGRLATSAAESRQKRASSQLRLPLGFSVNGAYEDRTAIAWSLRGAGQQETRTTETRWPQLTGQWVYTPRSRLRNLVTSVNATGGVNVSRSKTVQPPLSLTVGGAEATAGGVRTSQESRARPLTLGISWAARIVTNFSTTADRTRSERSNNLTLNSRRQTGADLTFSFRTPQELLPLPSDIRATVRFQTNTSRVCIQRAGATDCVPVSDSRRREYNLNMDTDMPPNVSAGLSVSYVLNEDAHANRKFSQFVVTANVTVSFSAGEIR